MVGSVLLDRMKTEGDFKKITPHFYSTSQAGQKGPSIDGVDYTLLDANSIESLKERVTKPSESVSGPVDVAVITKGDGFIWIKRKHYFDPNLNLRFVAQKNKQIGEG